MKKILFSVLALGLAFSSCSNVEDEGVSNGAKQTVNFELSAPEAFAEGTRAGEYVNSAKGGVTNLAGETITYHLAFYYGGNLEWSGTQTSTATSVKFQPELIIGEDYKLVAYATFGGAQADLTNIAVSSGINNEKNDAYSCAKDVEAAATMSAILTRPSAKLRFLAKDYETGKAHGFNITKVSVEYTNGYAETFNAYDGQYGAAGTTTKSEAAAVEYTETDNTVFTDYVPVNADVDETVKVVVTYTDGGVEKAREFDFTPVPLKRNYLTTIMANVWKEQAEVEVIIDEILNINFEYAAKHGGEVTLDKETTLSEPLRVSGDLVINLNGQTLNGTTSDILFRVDDGGSLTINGEGNVNTNLYVASANEGGVITINGGTYTSGTTCFQANGGEVYIKGGEFDVVDADKTYILNHIDGKKNDGLIEVTGGRFHGFDPANSNSENPAMNFVKPGYISTADGTDYVVGYAATTLDGFSTAINTESVVYMEDKIDNGTNVLPINNNNVVMNMNNEEYIGGGNGTNNYAFNVFGSNVEVNDANIKGAGFAVLDGSEVTVNSGAIAATPGKSGRNMFYVVGNSTVTVNEGNYTFDRTSCYFVYVEAGSTCYINGGHFEKPLANNASKDSFVNNASAGTVIIKGGTFNVDPTNWLADGYKATKSGKFWTVTAE
ncbi:MAG: hypothetical protein IJ421_08765 [Prevotella sp.]|nr:hypothetical protein [Prevotella sp.]